VIWQVQSFGEAEKKLTELAEADIRGIIHVSVQFKLVGSEPTESTEHKVDPCGNFSVINFNFTSEESRLEILAMTARDTASAVSV
jgi:hypothetical protein